MRFQCDKSDNNRVIFQASLVGTPKYWSYELIKDIEKWKNTSPVIVVEGLQLHVDNTCDIFIDEFASHAQCSTPRSSSTTTTTTSSIIKEQTDITDNIASSNTAIQEGNRYYAAGIFGMIGFGIIAAIAIIIVVLVLLRIKYLKKKRSV